MSRHEYLVITTAQEEYLLGVWARHPAGDDEVLRWTGRDWVAVEESWDAIVPRMRSWADGGIPHSAVWSESKIRKALPGMLTVAEDHPPLVVPYFPQHLTRRIRPWVTLPDTDDPAVRYDEGEDWMKRTGDHGLMKSEALGLSSERTCVGMVLFDADREVPEDLLRGWPRSERRRQAAWAEAIATDAHRGQEDKNGDPYIGHPRRVASRFDPLTHPIEHCAAWLHDVLEDTDWSASTLRDAGIRPTIVEGVELLTRDGSDAYYERIRWNRSARAVKLADIDDNLEPTRTARLDPNTRARLAAKYAAARFALGSDSVG